MSDLAGVLCEACPATRPTLAVRRIVARNVPDGYAVCATHERDRQGRFIPSDYRTWPADYWGEGQAQTSDPTETERMTDDGR